MTIEGSFLENFEYNNRSKVLTVNNENMSPNEQMMAAIRPMNNNIPLVAARTKILCGLSTPMLSPQQKEIISSNDNTVSSTLMDEFCNENNKLLSQSTRVNDSPMLKTTKTNLSQSCFAELRSTRSVDIDNDLTSLSWLQEGNLINGFSPGVKHKQPLKDEEALSLDSHTINDVDRSMQKPGYSFSTLIFMAIENAYDKRLPVKDIYKWIQDTFPYFQKAPTGWKNSVRHNLSLNKSFKKVDKEKCIGKGSLWTIDHEARAGLVQQLRKTATYHSYPFSRTHNFPQHYTKYFFKEKSLTLCKRDSSGRFVANHDDAEFDAAAIMCSLSAPAPLKSIDQRTNRCISNKTSAKLLRLWRTHIEPIGGGSLLSRSEGYTINNFLDDVRGRLLNSSKRNQHLDSSLDGDYEFFNSDDDTSDEEMNENMKRLVDNETDYDLGDSGYSERSNVIDHAYSKPYARPPESTGVAALLHLANAATLELANLSKEVERSTRPIMLDKCDQSDET